MDKATERRVEQLCEVSRELEKLGPMYLAMLLLQEAYARETLEQLVFGKGNLDAALEAAIARVRAMLARPGLPDLAGTARRSERHARRLRGILDLDARLKLSAAGQPLPDDRRRTKAVA